MLATTGELPESPQWAYEFKWDGVRALVEFDGTRLRIMSRLGNETTLAYPELAEIAEALNGVPAILDGEIVCFDESGRPNFAALQQRMHVRDPATARVLAGRTPVSFLAFDVLHLAGRSTRAAPYSQRRRILTEALSEGPRHGLPPTFEANGRVVLETARMRGLEGVVAKKLDSPYLAGRRSPWWVKVKVTHHQEVVIAGWQPGAGRRAGGVGSLLLGVPQGADLHYVGRVGTGFTEAMLSEIKARLSKLTQPTCPLEPPPPPAQARHAVWVRPQVVAEVAFTEWTPDGRLRHPTWRGLRPDKRPEEVRIEASPPRARGTATVAQTGRCADRGMREEDR